MTLMQIFAASYYFSLTQVLCLINVDFLKREIKFKLCGTLWGKCIG